MLKAEFDLVSHQLELTKTIQNFTEENLGALEEEARAPAAKAEDAFSSPSPEVPADARAAALFERAVAWGTNHELKS